GDHLKSYPVKPNGRLAQGLVVQSPSTFGNHGCTPTVSANGSAGAVVWVTENAGTGSPAILHAFDASNVATELYNSEQNSARDSAGNGLRFTIPMVAQGRVYVGTTGEVDVYGLIPSSQ
ncbi:MAG TPA: pyrrolo-quinoline quinone, partial [Blastocatellia bacterium]